MILAERVIALRTVMSAQLKTGELDEGYLLRKMIRWYSRSFNYTIDEVEESVPIQKVAQHFWEAHYEGLYDDGDRGEQAVMEEARRLTETRKERAERQKEKAVDDVGLDRLMAKERAHNQNIAEIRRLKLKPKAPPAPLPLPAQDDDSLDPPTWPPQPVAPTAQVTRSEPPKAPPSKFEFSEADFDPDADWDVLSPDKE